MCKKRKSIISLKTCFEKQRLILDKFQISCGIRVKTHHAVKPAVDCQGDGGANLILPGADHGH